jgi:hypothetical protein
MRPLQSQPVNWGGTDFSLNRGGQFMGQALANTGGILGNAIMEHAQKEEEKRKKKEQEDEAVKFLVSRGMPEADARSAAKGVGVENVIRFGQLDQQNTSLQNESTRLSLEASRMAQENLRLKQERDAYAKWAETVTSDPNADPIASMAKFPNMNVSHGLNASAQINDQRQAAAKASARPTVETVTTSDGRKVDVLNGTQVLHAKDEKPKLELEEVKVPGTTIPHFRGTDGKMYKLKNGEILPVSAGAQEDDMRAIVARAIAGAIQGGQPPPPMADEDKAALAWLQTNPKDPAAEGVRARLRAKGINVPQ